jgi:Flp pilus assembly protein TadD
MRDTLTEFPKDVETMNNLAYTLAKKLNKPEEGLLLIQQAAAIRADSPDVLDTLGVILLMTGKTDDAVSTLRKAEGLIQTPQDGATISIHLADALVSQAKKEEAKAKVEQADRFIAQLPSGTDLETKAKNQTKSDLEAVRQKIGTP